VDVAVPAHWASPPGSTVGPWKDFSDLNRLVPLIRPRRSLTLAGRGLRMFYGPALRHHQAVRLNLIRGTLGTPLWGGGLCTLCRPILFRRIFDFLTVSGGCEAPLVVSANFPINCSIPNLSRARGSVPSAHPRSILRLRVGGKPATTFAGHVLLSGGSVSIEMGSRNGETC
jgi:hypothetical protein